MYSSCPNGTMYVCGTMPNRILYPHNHYLHRKYGWHVTSTLHAAQHSFRQSYVCSMQVESTKVEVSARLCFLQLANITCVQY